MHYRKWIARRNKPAIRSKSPSVFGWTKQPPKALTKPDTEECSFFFGDGPLDELSPVDLLDLLEDSEEFASLFFDFRNNNFTPS